MQRRDVVADRILDAAHPGDVLIRQPARFRLVGDRRAAHTLDTALPPSRLSWADEVIT